MSAELLDVIEDRQGGPREYISPSRLGCWLACPLRWKFRYVDGLSTPTTPSLFVGKMVHAGLEIAYRNRQLGINLEAGDVTSRLLESWGRLVDEEEMGFDSPTEEQYLRKKVCVLVAAYLAYAPTFEKPLAVEVAIETPLIDPESGEDLGIPLLGVIDLVLDYEEGPLICDFKTAGRSSEPLEISHEIQLSSYAWLYRQVTGRQEGGLEIRSLIKTKVPKVEFHHYPARTDAHFRRLFSVLREYVDSLDAGRFNFRPGFGCGMCDFRERCSRWSGTS